MKLQFAVWWLKDRKIEHPIAGLGMEISAGGLQFMLQYRISQADGTIALEVNGRRMRANLSLVQRTEVAYKSQAWHQYSAKFVGMLSADFEFILALTDKLTAQPVQTVQALQPVEPVQAFQPVEPVQALQPVEPVQAFQAVQSAQVLQADSARAPTLSQPKNDNGSTNERVGQLVQFGKPAPPRSAQQSKSKRSLSVGELASFDMLSSSIQEQIVQKLIEMQRLAPPNQTRTPLMAPHYGGTQLTQDGSVFHRFFIRTRVNSQAGPVLYNTEILISDDSAILLVRL